MNLTSYRRRPRMSRITLPLLALIVAGGCTGRDATAPSTSAMSPDVGVSADRSPGESRFARITYEKWITKYPAMAGNANGVLGAFSGTIKQRLVSADGKIIHLVAEYVITDLKRKGHSFTALVEGDQSLWTNTAVLIGVVTQGWKKGAPVLVNFDVLTPCTVSTAPSGTKTCFQGTIRIGHSAEESDDDTSESTEH
jgi:hypothetical protein